MKKTAFVIYSENVTKENGEKIRWAYGFTDEKNGCIDFPGIIKYLLSCTQPDIFKILVWDYYPEENVVGAWAEFSLIEYKDKYMN